jgi:hypothetical protein
VLLVRAVPVVEPSNIKFPVEVLVIVEEAPSAEVATVTPAVDPLIESEPAVEAASLEPVESDPEGLVVSVVANPRSVVTPEVPTPFVESKSLVEAPVVVGSFEEAVDASRLDVPEVEPASGIPLVDVMSPLVFPFEDPEVVTPSAEENSISLVEAPVVLGSFEEVELGSDVDALKVISDPVVDGESSLPVDPVVDIKLPVAPLMDESEPIVEAASPEEDPEVATNPKSVVPPDVDPPEDAALPVENKSLVEAPVMVGSLEVVDVSILAVSVVAGSFEEVVSKPPVVPGNSAVELEAGSADEIVPSTLLVEVSVPAPEVDPSKVEDMPVVTGTAEPEFAPVVIVKLAELGSDVDALKVITNAVVDGESSLPVDPVVDIKLPVAPLMDESEPIVEAASPEEDPEVATNPKSVVPPDVDPPEDAALPVENKSLVEAPVMVGSLEVVDVSILAVSVVAGSFEEVVSKPPVVPGNSAVELEAGSADEIVPSTLLVEVSVPAPEVDPSKVEDMPVVTGTAEPEFAPVVIVKLAELGSDVDALKVISNPVVDGESSLPVDPVVDIKLPSVEPSVVVSVSSGGGEPVEVTQPGVRVYMHPE